MRRRSAVALTAGVVALSLQVVATQGPPVPSGAAYLADLAQRRASTAAALGTDTVLVLLSAPPRVYSADMNYEYRQESNLLYLSGLDQPETTLVLVPGAPAAREQVFVRGTDPVRELWEGHTLTPAEASERSGITRVFPQKAHEALDAFMDRLLSDAAPPGEFGEFSSALAAGRAKLAVVGAVTREGFQDASPAAGDADHAGAWARALARRHPRVALSNAADVLDRQREIKTPYEQGILRRSVEISAEAHVEGMKVTRPGRWEYQVEAAIEYSFHKNGALSWGYPSIVGSGPNATTLHYEASTRQMLDGDLVLVDAAGDYQGLTGDITRTYPVNGHFSPEQRAIYELVLQAQDAGIAAARPGSDAAAITRAVRAVLGAGLIKLGLVTDPAAATGESPQISWWFPHGPTHGIGMDVHDPLGTLDPGAAFVIEPGLYIRPDTLERLAEEPAQAAIARAVAPAVARYRSIGVRIEDSFLMTPTGPVMLSARAPRTVRDVEKVVGSGH